LTKRAFLSLVLCIAVLLAGPVQPFYGYAYVADSATYGDDDDYDDDEFYVDDGDDDDNYDDYDDNEPEPEPEPQNSTESKYQNQIDNISSQLSELQKEEEKLKQNIAGAKSELEKAQAEKAQIDQQVNLTQEQIALLFERINYLEQDIEDKMQSITLKQQEIEDKQREFDESFELLRKRLRAMYIQDTTSSLGLILGSDSFSDFLARTEHIRRIADHDRSLMAILTDQRIDLENEKLSFEHEKMAMEQVKLSVEADRLETEVKKQQLGVQQEKAQLQIQDIKSMEEAFLADLEKNKKIQDAAQAELDRIFREIEWSKNAYAGGVMAWPVPGYSSVTSEFGPRFGGTNMHTGIDISGSGVHGKPIVAANDGVVAKVNFAYSQGVGYGIYVIVDHGIDSNGNSISTLYAHCSSISVSVGQQVKRGQTIAAVGSTGWSTGPHLHFEVRINGSAVNPRPYIFS